MSKLAHNQFRILSITCIRSSLLLHNVKQTHIDALFSCVTVRMYDFCPVDYSSPAISTAKPFSDSALDCTSENYPKLVLVSCANRKRMIFHKIVLIACMHA